jgi:hypothetical protein
LVPVEYVEVFDRFVDFSILEFAQPIPVFTLEQHADESVQKVQVLRCWFH